MRHRSSLGSRAARAPRINPSGSARRRGLLRIAPARMLLGSLVTVGIAALLLAVPVVSGKVTAPPPAALMAPVLGAQSTAGSVVVMGQDGTPVQAAPTVTAAPSGAPTTSPATSTTADVRAATRAASSSHRAPSAAPPIAAGSAGRTSAGHNSRGPSSGPGSSSSSSSSATSPSSTATDSGAPVRLPTDTPPVPLPVDPPTILSSAPTPTP